MQDFLVYDRGQKMNIFVYDKDAPCRWPFFVRIDFHRTEFRAKAAALGLLSF